MYDGIVGAAHQDINWLHRALAPLGPVPWIFVDMLAPQALRAVIGVTVTLYGTAALLAGERLYGSLEPFIHVSSGIAIDL